MGHIHLLSLERKKIVPAWLLRQMSPQRLSKGGGLSAVYICSPPPQTPSILLSCHNKNSPCEKVDDEGFFRREGRWELLLP